MTGSRRSDGPLDEHPGDDRVELLADPSENLAVSTVGPVDTGRRGGAGGRSLAVLVGGLAAVLGLLWALSRPVSEPLQQPRPSATPSMTAEAPTTLPGPRATGGSLPTTSMVPGGPLLGEQIGLLLLQGGDGSTLQRLDLDSGELTHFGLEAHPVAVVAERLVLHQDESGTVGWLPLEDLGEQVKAWRRGPVSVDRLGIEVLDATADNRGFFGPDNDDLGAGMWRRFDSQSGKVVASIPADVHTEIGAEAGTGAERIGGVLGVLRTGAGLSERPDGVYRLTTDGFRRIAAGRVLADDRQGWASGAPWLALVGTCGPDGPCDLTWVEADTGEAVDRPLPGIRPRRAIVLPGDRWLLSIDWEGRAELLELATGRRIEREWDAARPTVSADGRWLAEWTDPTTVSVSDLSGGGEPVEALALTLVSSGDGPGSLLFAPAAG